MQAANIKRKKDYPKLKYLMRHFHQDWKVMYTSGEELLVDFAQSENPSVVTPVIDEISQFVSEIKDPRKMDKIFMDEWNVEPPYDSPENVAQWLNKARDILQKSLKKPKGSKPPTRNRIRPKIEEYPGLYLLMCQFDEYWQEVFETEKNVLKHFKKASSKQDVEACLGDIMKILNSNYDDAKIDKILREGLGGQMTYLPGVRSRGWLQHLLIYFRGYKPGVYS
jgi:hypothetical protein